MGGKMTYVADNSAVYSTNSLTTNSKKAPQCMALGEGNPPVISDYQSPRANNAESIFIS